MLFLQNAALAVRILPECGGGLAGFDWRGGERPLALMRPLEATTAAASEPLDPNRLACYPLLPWSNRIAPGGFLVDGQWVVLPPNRAGEPYPIHGSGWQRAWQVEQHTAQQLRLSLHESDAAGYSYAASLRYALQDHTLQVELEATNTGAATMPFGLGLHPFFPRHGEAILHAPAPQLWRNDGRSPLPLERVAVPPAWDFSRPRRLPDAGLDHAFEGWPGLAEIRWPRLRLGLQIEADAGVFVLYTPAGGDFFCFEPVDHPINALHLPGGAAAHGMTMLAPQATLRRRYTFRVLDI